MGEIILAVKKTFFGDYLLQQNKHDPTVLLADSFPSGLEQASIRMTSPPYLPTTAPLWWSSSQHDTHAAFVVLLHPCFQSIISQMRSPMRLWKQPKDERLCLKDTASNPTR